MNADKPLVVAGRELNAHELVSRGQPDALVNKLERKGEKQLSDDRPRMTKWGFQLLMEYYELLFLLVRAIAVQGRLRLTDVLTELVDISLPLLPLFTKRLRPDQGWRVIEDRGQPLPPGWDPRLFLKGLIIGCVYPDGQDSMKGEDLVTEARRRLAGRGGLSQHELAWFYQNWQDERIPKWFRDAVESGEIILVATETVLLDPNGNRFVLYLCWSGGRLDWRCGWLGSEDWYRRDRVLVPSDSSV